MLHRVFKAWIAVLALVLGGASCVRSAAVDCGDGVVCAAGTTCDVANQRCLAPGQREACEGTADDDPCVFEGLTGACRAGACELAICGDGVTTGAEACDGEVGAGLDCTDAGFYDPGPLTCNAFCRFETQACTGSCGDGVVNGPELCDGAPPRESCVDLGFDAGPMGCTGSCAGAFSQCGRFGWRLEATGIVSPNAIGGSGPDDVWIVGASGEAVRYRGGIWAPVATGVTHDLIEVHATAPDRAFAVGLGPSIGDPSVVLAWDGASWQIAPGDPGAEIVDLWLSATRVYAATSTGVIAWDGTGWQPVGALGAAVASISGSSDDDLWAAGPDRLWHWNGVAWSPALTATITRVIAAGPADAIAYGRQTPSFTSPRLLAEWDGQSWATAASSTRVGNSLLAASSRNDAWIKDGSLTHHDGHLLSFVDGPPMPGVVDMISFGPGFAIAVTLDGIAHRYRGQSFGNTSIGIGTAKKMWSARTQQVFVGTATGSVAIYDGDTAVAVPVLSQAVQAIWGAGPTAVWAGANRQVAHYDGTQWTTVLSGTSIENVQAIGGTSETDVWVFGLTTQHFDGTTWTTRPAPAPLVLAVAGSGPDDVWAATLDGVWRWQGQAWALALPTTSTVFALDVVGADVFAITADRTLHHYDGTTWVSSEIPVISTIRHLRAHARDDVFAATDTEVLHFDGARWAPVRSPPSEFNAMIVGIGGAAGRVDVVRATASQYYYQPLLRTRPWICRTTETACADGVDDDCDGTIDDADGDCP